jgi:misacylated tRNA(Ala) deacylase
LTSLIEAVLDASFLLRLATGRGDPMRTELLYLYDAYAREFQARVVAVRGDAVALDRTFFYPTGGGQAHDTGRLAGVQVTDVCREGGLVWHVLSAGLAGPVMGGGRPNVGDEVEGVIDWERRHALMRTHTAVHIVCGVIWNRWRKPVTGGNIDPLEARADFEFDPLPVDFGAQVQELVTAEVHADRPITVSFLQRDQALADADLIRTKVNLIPTSVPEIRVVDIEGLDKQADGGTHVRSTGEVGRIVITKTESKGKANKRIRFAVRDA